VEAKPWQALYAMALLERSKFGLNELLGRMLCTHDERAQGLALLGEPLAVDTPDSELNNRRKILLR
jgi:hypothetical protein